MLSKDVQNIEKQIDAVLKISKKEQNKLIRGMGKLDFESKIVVMKKHSQIFHQLRNQQSYIDEKSILSYCALILCLKSFNNPSNVDYRAMKLRVKNSKDKIKRQKLLGYWSIIKQLKNDNMSYRNISDYLKKYNKFEVSHSFVFKVWKEIEGEESNEEINY